MRWAGVSVLRLLGLVFLVGVGLLLWPGLAGADGGELLDPVVLHADGAGVELVWRAPTFSRREVVGADGRRYVILDAPGWAQIDDVGRPQVPYASVLVLVPPTGEVTLSVQVLERERYPSAQRLLPAPAWVPVGEEGAPLGLTPVWAPAMALERRTAAARPTVAIADVGWLRGWRLARLTFAPVQVDAAGRPIEILRRVRVALRFSERVPSSRSSVKAVGGDAFASILQSAVVNPAQLIPFARPPRGVNASSSPMVPAAAPADTDYLIVTHGDFITAVAPLATHRAISDGLRVYSTTVDAIYTAYSGGAVSAMAIRDYISATYHSALSPTLDYVLLVGDGTADGSGGQYVPPYVITVDPDWRPDDMDPWEAPSDTRFGMVDGDDGLTDVFVGRLPVRSVAEAEIVVDKILSYETNPPQWPWNERVLFFAGDEDGENFHYDSDYLYSTLPSTFSGRRAYFCTDGCTQPYHHETITAAHDAALVGIGGGGLLVSYVGHSSRYQWAVDIGTGRPMFHADDVGALSNGGALPVFLEMTCLTSDFALPGGDTLDERLVRHANGGAVATWGPTTLGRNGGHNVLAQAFFDAVFDQGVTTLGPVIGKAYLALESRGHNLDLLDTFVLLGDPAIRLNLTIVPWAHEVFLPLTLRGE